jgi:hypothetical protein
MTSSPPASSGSPCSDASASGRGLSTGPRQEDRRERPAFPVPARPPVRDLYLFRVGGRNRATDRPSPRSFPQQQFFNTENQGGRTRLRR